MKLIKSDQKYNILSKVLMRNNFSEINNIIETTFRSAINQYYADFCKITSPLQSREVINKLANIHISPKGISFRKTYSYYFL